VGPAVPAPQPGQFGDLRERVDRPALLDRARPGVLGQVRDRGLFRRSDGEPAGERNFPARAGQGDQILDQSVACAGAGAGDADQDPAPEGF
jgi:hypothetical protein